MNKSLLAVFAAIVLFAVLAQRDDGSVMVHYYDKTLRKHKINCLSYTIEPENRKLEERLKRLYHFRESCPYRLKVTYKNGIHCNSSGNAAKEASGAFPSAFIELELRRGLDLKYSYYRDLKEAADAEDLEDAFERFSSDLKLQ